jgi:hypothetical protein
MEFEKSYKIILVNCVFWGIMNPPSGILKDRKVTHMKGTK